MGRKRIMPTRKRIFEYWQDKINSALDDNTCFKCGFTGGFTAVERCHITSVFNNGTDDLDNLHLLCSNCHKQSEPYESSLYFDWFYSINNIDFMVNAMINFISDESKYDDNFSKLFYKAFEENKMNYKTKEDFKIALQNLKNSKILYHI